MATKPTIANARWANLGNNNAAPASGTRDTGFTNGTSIVSSYINALLLEAYNWFKYLSEGALTGAHTIAGSLGITGDQTVDGNINVASATEGKGEVAAQHFNCTEGMYAHATKPWRIPAIAGMYTSGSGTFDTDGEALANSGDILVVPIEVAVHQTVTKVGARVIAANGGTVTMAVMRVGTNTAIASVTSATGTLGQPLETIETSVAGDGSTGPYVARFTFSGGSGTHTVRYVEPWRQVLPTA